MGTATSRRSHRESQPGSPSFLRGEGGGAAFNIICQSIAALITMLHCGETYHNLRYASCSAASGRMTGESMARKGRKLGGITSTRHSTLPATCQHADTLERSRINPRPILTRCMSKRLQIACSPDTQAWRILTRHARIQAAGTHAE